MTPRLAEIIAAMLDATLDEAATAGRTRGIVARPRAARPRQRRTPPGAEIGGQR